MARAERYQNQIMIDNNHIFAPKKTCHKKNRDVWGSNLCFRAKRDGSRDNIFGQGGAGSGQNLRAWTLDRVTVKPLRGIFQVGQRELDSMYKKFSVFLNR